MDQLIADRSRLRYGNLAQVIEPEATVSDKTLVKWWEVALMFFILAISGNEYVSEQKFELFLLASTLIPVVHVVRNSPKPLLYRTMFIFVFLLGYEVIHVVMFKLDYLLTFIKLTLILLLSVAAVGILKERFIIVLTKTMVIISSISFVFVVVSYIPSIHNFLYHLGERLFPLDKNFEGHSTPTLILYTMCREYFVGELPYVRNASIFWESGAFAVFLNVTLFLHYSTKIVKVVKDLFDRDATVLIVAMVSTTSTMGAISLMVILAFFSAQLKTPLKYFLLLFILLATYGAFSTVDFLGEKVQRQLSESGASNNRFGSALKDFENIAERPLLGWSRRREVVFKTDVRSGDTHRPNGLTNFLRCYGLIYFCVYFYFVFSSFRNICRYHRGGWSDNKIAAFGIVILLVSSFSELIFELVFFKSLIFLFTAYAAYPASNFQSKEVKR
jgi:hypothetical protein